MRIAAVQRVRRHKMERSKRRVGSIKSKEWFKVQDIRTNDLLGAEMNVIQDSGGRLSRCVVKQVASLLRNAANHVQQCDVGYLPSHFALANSGNRFLKCFKNPSAYVGSHSC